jgi:hypothetical protein
VHCSSPPLVIFQTRILILSGDRSETPATGVEHMDVRARSVLIITLVASNAALAGDFHESLQPGVVCSSEDNPLKFQILESPAFDGFFNISEGLCKALPIQDGEDATLFSVGHCMLQDGQQFSLMFGGWLNMLTVRFDEKDESQDLFCR